MKKILILTLLTVAFIRLAAQPDLVHTARDLRPTEEYDNVHVRKLFGDARSTVFAIWIKSGVRLHKHAAHSETVYIIKGKGTMQIGQENREVRKGDVIFIPEGTPHAVAVRGKPMQVISIQAPEFDGTDRIWLDEK